MRHAVRALFVLSLWSLWVAAAGCNRTATRDSHGVEVPAAPAPATRPAAAPTTRETLGYLASDELEGRGVGTRGLDLAADYIADRFRRAGLTPLPTLGSYFQPFEMNMGAQVDAKATRLTAGGETLALDKAFKPLGFSVSGAFDGPVAFVGYGIASETHGYDDYAGVDVKGKVALAMRFEPHNEAGKSRFAPNGYSDAATFKAKADAAAARGAVALLVVNPPKHHGKDAFVPFAGLFTEGRAKIPVVQVTVDAANAMLNEGGVAEDLEALQAKIDVDGKPASVALNDVTAGGEIRIEHRKAAVKNVAGLLSGRGALKDEYVIVGAHYDHVGKSRMFSNGGKEGEIHNGADDNASGVSAMLGLAHAWATRAADAGDRRSIVFVAFTAEEWGLLGSQHFVQHPPVPLERVAAMLNMDMVGRIRNDILFISGTGTGAGLEAIVKAADEASPLNVKPGSSGFAASDHVSFLLKKIPVLFFFSGLHGDYHRPSDDADKINYAAVEQVVTIGREITDRLATGPRLTYVASAAEKSVHGAGSASLGGGGGGRRVTLGVVPDFASMDGTSGVRIIGTTPGTPAEAAGLKEGDVLTRFGDKPLENLEDLTVALRDSKAGDTVKLKFRREAREVDVDVTLAERKE